MEFIEKFLDKINLSKRINDNYAFMSDAVSKLNKDIFGSVMGFEEEIDEIASKVDAYNLKFLKERRSVKKKQELTNNAIDELRDIIACSYHTPRYYVGCEVGGYKIISRIPVFQQVESGYNVSFHYMLEGKSKRYLESDLDVIKNTK